LFAVFILKGKTEFARTLVSIVEHRHDRRFLRAVFNDLDVMLAAFIRAQLTLASLSLLAYTVVLVLAHFRIPSRSRQSAEFSSSFRSSAPSPAEC
jgi:predicted PurR-regulated permease PerM